MKIHQRALLVIPVLGLTVILGLIWALDWQKSISQSTESPRRYVIEIGDFFFDPPGLLIQPGDTIEWVFREITVDGHSVTAYHPANRKELRIPEMAQPFHSEIRDKVGDTFALTFDAIGVYDYFCLPHEFFGMVGRLIVKEPSGPGTKPVTVGMPEAAQKVIPPVEEVMGPIGLLFRLSAEVNTALLEYERSERESALRLLDETLKDFQAGAGKENSLFETLQRVQLVSAVQQKLEGLRSLVARNATLPEITNQAKELKALLAEARKRLKSN